jgi:uncharacterized peroxidase-related enzyme
MSKPIGDFTRGELSWEPWITPVDLHTATQEQREALKITPSQREVGAYSLLLAHDPSSLSQRSPLYNAIMFGTRGLPRADRELGAVATSRENGCSYCASVHAKRFVELTKRSDVIERIYQQGSEASLDPRHKAVVDFSTKLTRDPAAIDAGDAALLRAQGLSDAEILDLVHAIAMFAWANRLMQSLGEPTPAPR